MKKQVYSSDMMDTRSESNFSQLKAPFGQTAVHVPDW